MKPIRLRRLARQDLAGEGVDYRREAGVPFAQRKRRSVKAAFDWLELSPGTGSPVLGGMLGIDGMRVWRLDGFPISIWDFERVDHVDVVRLVGQRQDQSGVLIGD